MAWYNPWGEIDELKAKLAAAEQTYIRLTKHIEELEFINKENEREIDELGSSLDWLSLIWETSRRHLQSFTNEPLA
jgi:chromosome segregation ATPase